MYENWSHNALIGAGCAAIAPFEMISGLASGSFRPFIPRKRTDGYRPLFSHSLLSVRVERFVHQLYSELANFKGTVRGG